MTDITIRKALAAQNALREAAGLGEEHFSVEEFVGMVSDEIDALRAHGTDDEAIAALINKAGISVTVEQIKQFYASSEQRHRESN